MTPIPRLVHHLAWLAAACFVAGWLLPVAADLPGWKAFRYAFAPVWPYATRGAQAIEDAAPQVLSALTNVMFVVMFALLIKERVTRPGLYLRVAIACFALNLYWPVQMIRDGSAHELLIGYYVWLAAFALLVATGGILVRQKRPAP